MTQRRHPLELSPDRLARRTDPTALGFQTTTEVQPSREIIGQPRGVRAIEFGIDMPSPGYNIYVMGPRGTGRLTAIEQFIEARAHDDPTPDDWLYVHNFDQPHQPVALRLPAGKGRRFRDDMYQLVRRLATKIPHAFESPRFTEMAQTIKREFTQRRDMAFQQLQTMAAEKGFVIRGATNSIILAPLKEEQSMSQEERDALTSQQAALEEQIQDAVRGITEIEEEALDAYDRLQRETTARLLNAQLKPLRKRYADYPDVLTYLDNVEEDILNHIDAFARDSSESAGGQPPPPDNDGDDFSAENAGHVSGLRRYEVNLFVDHSGSKGAPVVVVTLPTYQNLVGRIEHRVFHGVLTTDFTMLKPGALHQANGGFLVVKAQDILQQPFAWEALKRALTSKEIVIEEPQSQRTGVITTQVLEPAPIPARLKVIMVGNPDLYYELFDAEEDFPELFKVKADFAAEMDRTSETEAQYAAFVAARCQEEALPPFAAAAVGQIIDYGSWLAEDQQRLSTRFGEIADLIREAAYHAHRRRHPVVTAEDVASAIQQRQYRSNLYEELSRRQIIDGDVTVATEGEVVGQINGLTVVQLGDYAFGLPNRITARVYVGEAGVVQIEREVQLSGPIHDKGVLILRGYLGSAYALDFPLSLTASLTFEQNYGGIEGDSASSTELYALLSALSGYPIRQELAVTGSVDQRGMVQPVGGATVKIEGFFHICQARGLTGRQGVIIPRASVRSLMLSDEVIAAVKKNLFHIYAIDHIDQGIELLTGRPAGERRPDGSYPPDSVHDAVQARLRALAEGMRAFAAPIVHIQQGE